MKILINKMFAGSYLDANIGHEVINLFKDDDRGDNYVYVCPHGYVGAKHQKVVEQVLHVMPAGTGRLRVLAKASGLEYCVDGVKRTGNELGPAKTLAENEILARGVKYGGVDLYSFFCGQPEPLYITYKADSVLFPAKPLYLVETDEEGKCGKVEKNGNSVVVFVASTFLRSKMFVHENDELHSILENIINDIKANLPASISESRRLVAARDEFIGNAKREAESVRKNAEETARRLIDEQEIVRDFNYATVTDNMIAAAEGRSSELMRVAGEYVDEMMRKTEESLDEALSTIRRTQAAFHNQGASAAVKVSAPEVAPVKEEPDEEKRKAASADGG